MCSNLFTHTQDIWLLGDSISAVWPSLSIHQSVQEIDIWRPREVADWESFQRRASKTSCIPLKRLVLLADASALTHQVIYQIRQYREQNTLFAPAIYFDKPDLGKFIHTFNSDLAGYCAATDTREEMVRLFKAISAGRNYYSPGFCQMVEDFGFPIAKGDEGQHIKN